MIWAIGHQFPSLMRAYGDSELFSKFKSRFLLAPLALLIVSFSSFICGLNGIFLLAGVWGLWHFVMQAFGFVRIYDAKVNMFHSRTRFLDKAMCFSWFIAAVALNDNALFRLASMLSNCGISHIPPVFFTWFRGIVTSGTMVVTVAFALNWFRCLRTGKQPNLLKLFLMASTFACFWYSTSTMTNIVIAYAYFELFHDIQYLTIVWVFNRSRVRTDDSIRGFTRFLFRPRIGLIFLYLVIVVCYGLVDFGTKTLIATGTLQHLLFACFLTTALLHYYFDGFIWKLSAGETRCALGLANSETSRMRRPLRFRPRHGLLWIIMGGVLGILTYTELSKRLIESSETIPEMQQRVAIESQQWAAAMPNSYRAHYFAGLSFEQRGKIQDAERSYKKALSILPEFEDASNGLRRIGCN